MCGNVVSNACDHIVNSCTATGVVMPYGNNVTACKDANTGLGAIAGAWGSLQGGPANNEDSVECRVYHALVGWNGGTPTPGTDVHCNHTYYPSGYTGVCSGAVSTNNQHYCDTTLNYCSANALAQYNTLPECLSSIALFPNTVGTATGGDARAANGANDQGCRQYHTQAAASGAGNVHCTHGGPSGQYVCGGNSGTRDSWRIISTNPACVAANLSVWGQAISAAFAAWDPADLAAVIPTLGNSSVPGTSYTTGFTGDNDFCRTYHCTVASTGGVTNLTHCEHCSIQSSQCFAPGTAPAVGAVCRMIQTACGTTNFADVATCITKLTPLLTSKPGDATSLTPAATDTFACRAYQAGVALAGKKNGGAAGAATACASAKDTAGPACGGSGTPAKSGAATLLASAAFVLPFLM